MKALFSGIGVGISAILSVIFGLSTYATSGVVDLWVNIDTSVAMTIHSTGDGEVTYASYDPAENKEFDSFNADDYVSFGISAAKTKILPNMKNEAMNSVVTVYTNSAEGYTLTVSDADGDTNLVSGKDKIPTGAKIEPGISMWGIKGGTLTAYSYITPISTQTTVKTLNTKTTNGDSTTFTYGISTDGDQPMGVYQDVIVYTVTTNEPINIAYMQDFDSSFMLPAVNDTMRIVDRRDNKIYTAARLADGKVWMTRNLAFSIDSNRTYTPDDTDLKSDWTPDRSTIASDELDIETWGNSYTAPYSYDSGNPTLGNYYNWSAAVAMNNSSSLTSGYAETSICPKGWTLPRKEDYIKLATSYGLPTTNKANTVAFKILESEPLNFVRAGYVFDGIMNNYSGYGYYWASTVKDSLYAYRLDYSEDIFYPQNSKGRRGGFTVRCIAR